MLLTRQHIAVLAHALSVTAVAHTVMHTLTTAV
jgi:hypothetical protein